LRKMDTVYVIVKILARLNWLKVGSDILMMLMNLKIP